MQEVIGSIPFTSTNVEKVFEVLWQAIKSLRRKSPG
jgi:hypothetical protein